MKKQKILTVHARLGIVLGAILFLISPVFAQSAPVWRVDNLGNITVDGMIFRVRGASWTGLEGRQEPSAEPTPMTLAPMELYIGNPFWAESGRTIDQTIAEYKALGFNLVRLPIVPQTLDPNDPQGREPYLKNAPSVRIENARLAMETVIRKLDAAGIYVLIDVHSCSNYLGWRAGRLDARPPYPDRDWTEYDFKREDCSCAATDNPSGVTRIQAFDVSKWLVNLHTLAGLGTELGVSNIMGIDIFNEPWDYTWNEWRWLIEQAYQAINAVNPNILIFAQGVSASAGKQDGTSDTITQVPHGTDELSPYRGENLYEAGANPPAIPKNRLVFSPHTYGPSMLVQKMFMDPTQPQCAGLEGDAAGDTGCSIVINPTLLEQGWEEHFGYLKRLGYAIVIGEFGGNPDWPRKAERRDQSRYSYLTDTMVDWQWQNAFVSYLVKSGIRDAFYWSLNPESLNTGGIYTHAYDPITNTGGWGTWLAPDQRKLDLMQTLAWPEPPLTPTPISNTGDVNGDTVVNIVDALMIAQHSAGLHPANFNSNTGDVNCDGNIDILDALSVARYAAGLLSSFTVDNLLQQVCLSSPSGRPVFVMTVKGWNQGKNINRKITPPACTDFERYLFDEKKRPS